MEYVVNKKGYFMKALVLLEAASLARNTKQNRVLVHTARTLNATGSDSKAR